MLLPLVVEAAQLSATVESYNSASLSGEVPEALNVSYLNQGSTKGQVVAGGKSTLTLTNWPDATIQGITLYVRSNQSSGAASVRVSVGGSSWLVAEGNFNQWPDMNDWSESFQPMQVMHQAIRIKADSVLKIEITGTTNSVYLQKAEVTYTLTPPLVHTVTLQYPSDGAVQSITLMEDQPLDGVVLPSVPRQDSIIADGATIWYWYGWSEQPTVEDTNHPLCWQQGDWYGMGQDMTLYAVYTNEPVRTIVPTKTCTDGEYALMIAVEYGEEDKQPKILMGNWVNAQMNLTDGDIAMTQAGKWCWQLDHLSDTLRYQIDFDGDSLTIYHLATQSWIGHNQSSGGNKSKASNWAWRYAADSTILIYGSWRKTSNKDYATCLTLHLEDLSSELTVAYQEDLMHAKAAYWYLYDVADIPRPGEAHYSSLLNYVALTETPASQSIAIKYLDKQGRLIIHTNQHKSFTLLGTPL